MAEPESESQSTVSLLERFPALGRLGERLRRRHDSMRGRRVEERSEQAGRQAGREGGERVREREESRGAALWSRRRRGFLCEARY